MIEVKNLSYTYRQGLPGEHRALEGISMTVPDGTVTAVIGRTGSGKSTLIQHFNGLIKPPAGTVFLDGEDILNLSRRDICRRVGLVFQYPEHQLFEETVYKDIAFGPKNLGFGETEIKDRVHSAAELTGLDKKSLEKSPFELSGGQKRRAAIAGVLATEPSTLVLDEPAAGLDPRGRREIFGVIKNLRARGMTVVFVSHSMEEVADAAEHITVLNDGKIDMDGTVSEVFSQAERLEQIGLGVPQITRLTERLRLVGYDIPEGIYTVGDAAAAIKKLLTGVG